MKCQKASCGREIELRTVDGDPMYLHVDGDDSHGAQVPLAKEPKA
jgi:hypothetical protein